MAEFTLARLFFQKLREQVEAAERLLALVPDKHLDWRPPWGSGGLRPRSLGELLGHLLECLAGFCAALHALHPGRLAHFERLRELPVNHRCEPDEARRRLHLYVAHLDEGFALVTDQDLARRLPTVFAPDPEAFLTILLANLEHLISHKHELFVYLKLLDIPIGTRELYGLATDASSE
jgi:hypothetical protein